MASLKHEDIDAEKNVTIAEATSPVTTSKSPGVQRIEAITASFTPLTTSLLFLGIFFISYSYGLDGQTRYVYQATATNAYATHSLLATINVVRSVMAAACQPAYARVADLFGRMELILLALLFYVLGSIIEASSNWVEAFAGGAVLYQLGLTGLQLLVEVLIADTTTLRNRLFWAIFPATPFIINTWISGNVTTAVGNGPGWRWGVGMWSIILPVVALPTIFALFLAGRRARSQGLMPPRNTTMLASAKRLFWQLDLVGLILLAAVLALILVPLTIAGGIKSRWHGADVIAMLVIGFCTIPVFTLWELRYAKHPAIPFHLLNDRSIIGGCFIALLLNASWYLQGDYLYTVLVVAFDESVASATRISSLYSFASVITCVCLSLVVRYVRYIKPFQIAGIAIFTLAMGLLVKYRGENGAGRSGMIGAQVLLGIGGGLFSYPTQVLVQAATKHEHVAVITALYLTAYQIGSGIGNSISGAIWTNTLPSKLATHLGPINATLVPEAYSSPLTVILSYPVGTPERAGIIRAYNETQRLLCIAGVCLCVGMWVAAAVMRNPRLGDKQSLDGAEGGSTNVVDKHARQEWSDSSASHDEKH